MRLEDLSWFDAAVIGVVGGCVFYIVALLVVMMIRSAVRWELLATACGGEDAAMRVLQAMQDAREQREAHTQIPPIRPRSKPCLRLVKS